MYKRQAYSHEKRLWDMTVSMELFLELYSAFCEEELPEASTVEGILRSYVNDYCQDMMEQRIREGVDPKLDFAADIIMNSDLSDLRYLYKYGEYVSENEIGVAEFLNSLSQDEIDKMASTYTEGYRIGFITGRKDITKKKTVNIRYSLGFERMVKAAIIQFRKMGLDPVIYRHCLLYTSDINRRTFALANKTGGMSGPAVKPVAVRMVYQVANAVSLPIIGMGGIATAEDALEFIMAGATAVSVGTANFFNPYATEEIVKGIQEFLERQNVADINELIGVVK